MAIVNTSKPTTSLTNSSKISIGETWGSITTTWASETRTWGAVSQLFTNTSRSSSSLIDSNVQSPGGTYLALTQADLTVGMSFTSGNIAQALASVNVYLKKSDTPTGSVRAVLKAHSGVYGTSSVPTGSALATSDAIPVSSLTTSFVLSELLFSGGQQYHLDANTHYCIEFTTDGTTEDNEVHLSLYDNGLSSHSGNTFYSIAGVYHLNSDIDAIFSIYGLPVMTNTSKPV